MTEYTECQVKPKPLRFFNSLSAALILFCFAVPFAAAAAIINWSPK